MKLIDEWRYVLRRTWSIRMILLAGFFSGAEAVVQIAVSLGWLDKLPLPAGVLAMIGFMASNLAFITRILAQKESHADE